MSSSFRPLAKDPHDPFGPIDMTLGGDCSAMIARLDIFLDGELTETRRHKIQSHLDSCPSCYGVFDFEAELRIVIRTKTVTEVPPELVARIRQALYGPL